MSDATYLDKILDAKRADLRRSGERPAAITARQLAQALQGVGPARDLVSALRQGPRPSVIAEFKRASPSKGPLRPGADVREIVEAYTAAGAAALSILCDRHFDGSLQDLRTARACTHLPLLCKDFILERSQILEARRAGADAVLLIVAALEPPTLKQLIDFAHDLGLQVLAEAHDDHEIDRAMSAGAKLVGGNARDLRTFHVDLQRAIDLRKRVPTSFTYVAESGIERPEDVARMRDAGVDAVLVGSSLMTAEDPGEALRALLQTAG